MDNPSDIAPSGARLVQAQRLIVGISGASGVILGIRLLQALRRRDETTVPIESHLILTPAAKVTIRQETDWQISQVEALAHTAYKNNDIGAPPASGSFDRRGMVVAPCSIKTLSAIANSYSADLLTRAADVTLKEGYPLILMVRETPLHRGHLRLLSQAAEAGAIIFPPLPTFYARPASVEQLIDQIVGRVLKRLGIENDLYGRWGEMVEAE